MASTNLTFDVAIWFVPADARLAGSCARHLARRHLRVTMIPCHPCSDDQYAVDPRLAPSARANAAIVGRRGASVWMETLPACALWLDPDLLTLLGPGLAAGTGRLLHQYLPGRVWD